MIQKLFKAIDQKDSEGFANFLSHDCIFRFGNAPEVQGRVHIKEVVAGFFSSIARLQHSVEAEWETPGGAGCHGTVTYGRLNGTTLTVPFANILELDAGGIRRYLIFVDASALFD